MISLEINPGTETHKKILNEIRWRIRQSSTRLSDRAKQWRLAEELSVGYMPEQEQDALKRTKRELEGVPEYTTVQLPYSYAVLMAAHSYWCTVFLARSPVIQYMGTTDEGEMQVQALEALTDYQMNKGRMLANLFIWLQDVGKYGESWMVPYWRRDFQRVSEIKEVEDLYLGSIPTGNTKKVREIKEIIGYEGNALANISPQNVYTDPRYPRNRYQDGEFIGVKTTVSWNQLVEGKDKGQYINIEQMRKRGRKSTSGADVDVTEHTHSDSLLTDRPDIDAITNENPNMGSDVFEVFEVTVNLIPKDWGLGKSHLPEKWVFTVSADFNHLVEVRPLGNLHNKFPLVYLELEAEGYANFSRGLVEVFGPIQHTIDWLVNSHFYNVRQVLNNQFTVDPSRIEMRDVENRRPGGVFRLKPAAYGTPVESALKQHPVQDVTQSHLGDMSMMYQMGERLGVSDTVMGIGHPSSRRSAQEVRGSQTFSTSRLKTVSEYFSATGFMDLGSMLAMNSQQFYNGDKKMKIVGEVGNLAGGQFINVTPEMIVGEYGFVPVDGTLPVDRYAQANLWRELIMQMSKVPQVIQQYDLGKIFGYVAQLAGIKNINRFKIEVLPDQQMLDQAQQGNVVPMQSEGNVLEPGQIAGMGPTA